MPLSTPEQATQVNQTLARRRTDPIPVGKTAVSIPDQMGKPIRRTPDKATPAA
jgi:hypothetical protein